MALPISIPYTFASATTSIPLSNLDTDFATVVNTINGIGNGTVGLTTITSPAATALTIQSSGTTAMTIDTSQNVGIGTTSPSTYGKFVVQGPGNGNVATIVGNASLTGAAPTYKGSIRLIDNPTSATASDGGIEFLTSTFGSGYGWKIASIDSSGVQLTFATRQNSASWTEAMRIDTSGNLLVGTTSTIISGPKLQVSATTVASIGAAASVNTNAPTKKWSYGPDANGNFVVFNDASAGMYMVYGGTSWTSSSDERVKTDLVPIENAAAKVSSLRSVTGRFKTDEEGTSRAFLIAQDVQAVLPEAVDATNPDKLGVQYTDVIPLLVAAIQELSAKNDALEARLAALEVK